MNQLPSSTYSGKLFPGAYRDPSLLAKSHPLCFKDGMTKHPHSMETGESLNNYLAEERIPNQKRKLQRRPLCFLNANKTLMPWTLTGLWPRKELSSWERANVSSVGNRGILVGEDYLNQLWCSLECAIHQQCFKLWWIQSSLIWSKDVLWLFTWMTYSSLPKHKKNLNNTQRWFFNDYGRMIYTWNQRNVNSTRWQWNTWV